MKRIHQITAVLVGLWSYGGGGTVVASPSSTSNRALSPDRSQSSSPDYDFNGMSKLIQRLDVLESSGPETLLEFYDPRSLSFSIKPGGGDNDVSGKNATVGSSRRVGNDRMCITSTCYALLTMCMVSPDAYKPIMCFAADEDDDKDKCDGDEGSAESADENENGNDDHLQGGVIPIRRVTRELLASKCRPNDLVQIPVLLYTLLKIDADRSVLRSATESNPYVAAKVKKLVSTVIAARPHRSCGAAQENSDYVIYQICKVLALLQEDMNARRIRKEQGAGAAANTTSASSSDDAVDDTVGLLPTSVFPENAGPDVFWALLRCNEVSFNELCRQLAYRTAGDLNSFDVIRLAYSLLTYIRSTEALSGVAGRENVKGRGPSPDTKVAPLNGKLVTSALAAFFEEQNGDGLWNKGQPIFKSLGEGRGRDMGNAFVFSVNAVGSLLCSLPAEDFRPHLAALERTLRWIEDHQTVEIVTTRVDGDGNCYGRSLRGWSSPHALGGPRGSGPQAWPSAQVLKCVSWMNRVVRQLMHDDVLEEFGGAAFSKKGVQAHGWENLLDTDLGVSSPVPVEGSDCGDDGQQSMKSVLEERIVHPFAGRSIDDVEDSPSSCGAAYSCILFGPPGTAKTTIAETLAQRLGYDFVCVDTAAFLADGLTNVAARIRYVFSRLMALKKCVILFDEIEEFALDRENKDLSMESRMLTTAMLTAINDLRRIKRSVFFIATNRLHAFDKAITRPGRFDMQIFIGAPNLESRIVQLRQKLSAVTAGLGGGTQHISEETKVRAIDAYRAFLESVWEKDAMFMNYLEGLQFASSCANVVASKKELTMMDMSNLWKKRVAVMTVRGAGREEYLANMEMTRL